MSLTIDLVLQFLMKNDKRHGEKGIKKVGEFTPVS
jgi:hypothetical protein